MSLYIHHIPGRLRVRTQSFRCRPGQIESASRGLSSLEGVNDVAVNARAGSITVRYDPGQCTQGELLAVLEELGCISGQRNSGQQPTGVVGGKAAGLFGKALVGALAQTLAQRSVQTLVGVLR